MGDFSMSEYEKVHLKIQEIIIKQLWYNKLSFFIIIWILLLDQIDIKQETKTLTPTSNAIVLI